MGKSVMRPDHPGEAWVPAPCHEGLYEVSDLGRIWSIPRICMGRRRAQVGGNLLAQGEQNGYASVALFREGVRDPWAVHRLVLTAFRGPCPEGLIGCHGEGGKHDNRLVNLYWGTYDRNNGEDRYRDGTAFCGEINNKSKFTNATVLDIRDRHADGETCRALAIEFGVARGTVERIVNGSTWQHLPCYPPSDSPPGHGEAAPSAKLTDAIVRECRLRYAGGESVIALAGEFRVERHTVANAVARRSWKHVA